MNKEFIPFEEAIQLKELGFDIPSISGYSYPNSDELLADAILYQQGFRWFREKHQLYAWVKVDYEYGGVTPTYYITGKRQSDIAGGAFNTYEEAELACLKKLIELVKQKS